MDIHQTHQLLLSAIQSGPDAVVKFYDELEHKGHSTIDLVEFAFQVLEKSQTQTGYTAIYKAGFIIEKFADPKHLDRLIKLRPNLPGLPGLRDYRVDFDHYIQLLKDKRDGVCICRSYSSTNTAPENPNFKVNSTDHANYTTYVSCIHCGQKYKVEVDLGYHFPIFHWSGC